MTAAIIEPPLTRRDVEEIVGRVVGEVVSEALMLISKGFEKVYARFDAIDKRLDRMDARFDRLEHKLDKTSDSVAHHSIDIRALQRKTAKI